MDQTLPNLKSQVSVVVGNTLGVKHAPKCRTMTLEECQMKLVLMGASHDNLLDDYLVYRIGSNSIYLNKGVLDHSFISNTHDTHTSPYLSYRQIIDTIKESL
jgi:hypothetical protein